MDVDTTHLKHHKWEVVPSKAYTLDRSLPAENNNDKTHYFTKRRGLSVGGGEFHTAMQNTVLPMIHEELSYENNIKGDKHKEPFLYKTKHLGGTSIFPKYSEEERKRKIVDLDPTC